MYGRSTLKQRKINVGQESWTERSGEHGDQRRGVNPEYCNVCEESTPRMSVEVLWIVEVTLSVILVVFRFVSLRCCRVCLMRLTCLFTAVVSVLGEHSCSILKSHILSLSLS